MLLEGITRLTPADFDELKPKFPKADPLQWQKLKTLVQNAVDNGGEIDLGAISEVQVVAQVSYRLWYKTKKRN